MEIREPLEDTESPEAKAASAPAPSVAMAAGDRREPIRREEAPASAAVDSTAAEVLAAVADAEAEADGIANRGFAVLGAERKSFTWREAICGA
jgi:hypothetical protein